MFRENVRQQLRHPPLNGVRVAVDECAHAKDGGVQLANRRVVGRGLPVVGKLAVLDEPNESVLEGIRIGEHAQRDLNRQSFSLP